jgi:hypothetical protein
MDLFYIIVSGIALLILILILTIMGIGMNRKGGTSASAAWPPIDSSCPDYWNIDPATNNCIIPPAGTRNVGTLYTTGNTIASGVKGINSTNTQINFNDPYYIACNKKLWAKTWGVYWDGYTNYNGCTN